MKNIIVIFAVRFLLQDVFSNEALLSKFHQNGYKIRDQRMQLINYDEETFNFLELKVFKYNRTTTAHNCTVNLKIDLKDNTEALVQVFKLLSNEYRKIPMRFQINLKKSVDSNAIGLRQIKNCGNLTSFYFYKDVTYHFCNFVANETQFPPLIPNGKYRADVTLLYFGKEIALIALFGEVYTPVAYPKH